VAIEDTDIFGVPARASSRMTMHLSCTPSFLVKNPQPHERNFVCSFDIVDASATQGMVRTNIDQLRTEWKMKKEKKYQRKKPAIEDMKVKTKIEG